MINKIKVPMVVLGTLLFMANSHAASLPSCATIAKLPESASNRLLTVMIDKTTVVDGNLISKFSNIAAEAIKPSTDVSIYTFSAFSQGEYFTESFAAKVEAPLLDEVRYSLPKKSLKIYDRCLAQQQPGVVHQSKLSIDAAMHGARADLAKSDIMYSLGQVAEVIKQTPANEKYLLLFSDMLENSAVTSFYKRNRVRKVDLEKELELVESSGMFADFGGAKVYVMGAGLVSEQSQRKGVYRDPATLQALNVFWKEWFKRSNAEVIDFGMPELRFGIQ